MIKETFTFQGQDGKSVFTRRWLPDSSESVKGTVQISHGMAEHSKRYSDFADRLTKNGFAVYANDHRGHGETEGHVEKLGYFADNDGWNLVVSDMNKLNDIIQKAHPGIPVFIFGHSMGSFLSRDYMFTYPEKIEGVILSGTGGDPGFLGSAGIMITSLESKLRGKKAQSRLMDKMSFGSFNKAFRPNRTAFDWLSRDEKKVDQYIDDPFCGTIFTAGFFRDLLCGIKKINKASNIEKIPVELPIYLYSGTNDPVGDFTKGAKQVYNSYKKAGIKDLSLKFYEEGRHEMLNEINREEVMNDIVDWLENHLP